MKRVARRTMNSWTTSDGSQTVKAGDYYIIIDENDNKYKLLGFESHWVLKNKFGIVTSSFVSELMDMKETKLKAECIQFAGEENHKSLFDCIKQLQKDDKKVLLAWANEDLVIDNK
jgi:hypothetical protein